MSQQHAINLLPEAVRARNAAGMVVGRAITAMVLLGAALVVTTTHSRVILDRAQNQLRVTQAQADLVLSAEEKQQQLQRELDDAQDYITRYNELAQPLDVSRILATVLTALPPSVTLERVDVDAGYRRPVASPRSATPAKDAPKRAPRLLTGELAGFAAADKEIAELVAALKSMPPFEAVSLDFSRTRPVRQRGAREFRISFRVDLESSYLVTDAAPREVHDMGVVNPAPPLVIEDSAPSVDERAPAQEPADAQP